MPETAVRERPIHFPTDAQVRAVLEGRKTEHRMLVKPQPKWEVTRVAQAFSAGVSPPMLGGQWVFQYSVGQLRVCCPVGLRGDRLWLREAFALRWPEGVDSPWISDPAAPGGERPVTSRDCVPVYRATFDGDEYDRPWDEARDRPLPWQNPLHMPRWASRLTLEITEVRVERLQEISEEGARAEGISTSVVDPQPRGVAPIYPKQYLTARDCFRDLWDAAHARRGFGWDANPWVWTVGFRRMEDA
ncbi:MAG TPA: hypothetical protein VD970_00950 [Acetobacteraceae bacterium]|nr:hypothetical protein [Acetobacteraceae bacterium]